MVFEHSNYLYALLLLVIPLLVHLFQFRKFKKIPFSNVQFLKKINSESRHSKSVKKWLLLASRSALFACLVFAFAQPKLESSEDTTVNHQLIFLDNSLSMSALNGQRSLFKAAIQSIITDLPDDLSLSFFTIDQSFLDTTLKIIRNDILESDYSIEPFDLDQIISKYKEANRENSKIDITIISDFQNTFDFNVLNDVAQSVKIVQLLPNDEKNISIDSLYIKQRSFGSIELGCRISQIGFEGSTIPIGLYLNDKLKTKSTFNDSNASEVIFNIEDKGQLNGYVTVEDSNFQFDNSLYFSIKPQTKPNVLLLSDSPQNYLKRIFSKDEFEIREEKPNQVDYASLDLFNLIILSEISTISPNLENRLKRFIKEGGRIVLIPNINGDLKSYNNIIGQNIYQPLKSTSNKVFTINKVHEEHELFRNVFSTEVQNFQYPTYSTNIEIRPVLNRVLSNADGAPFAAASSQFLCLAGPLSGNFSNFTSSPLIVPLFYNFGIQGTHSDQLYFYVGQNTKIEIVSSKEVENAIRLENDNFNFIPLQRISPRGTTIELKNQPSRPGVYFARQNSDTLSAIGFNYNRSENRFNYANADHFSNLKSFNNISEALSVLKKEKEKEGLWKWFLIFALVFMGSEWLILKFIK